MVNDIYNKKKTTKSNGKEVNGKCIHTDELSTNQSNSKLSSHLNQADESVEPYGTLVHSLIKEVKRE